MATSQDQLYLTFTVTFPDGMSYKPAIKIDAIETGDELRETLMKEASGVPHDWFIVRRKGNEQFIVKNYQERPRLFIDDEANDRKLRGP